MELHRTEQGFALYKEKDCIGECCLSPAPKGAQLAALCILPQWRRKGYGSYLLKEVLRSFGGYDREAATVFTAPLPENAAERERMAWVHGPSPPGRNWNWTVTSPPHTMPSDAASPGTKR